MRKVLLAVFGDTRAIEATLGATETVEVLACPAAVEELQALDFLYDAVLVIFDPAASPWEERDARARAVDFVNLNLAFRIKGGAKALWL